MIAAFLPLWSRNKSLALGRKIYVKTFTKTKFLCIVCNSVGTKMFSTKNPEINVTRLCKGILKVKPTVSVKLMAVKNSVSIRQL